MSIHWAAAMDERPIPRKPQGQEHEQEAAKPEEQKKECRDVRWTSSISERPSMTTWNTTWDGRDKCCTSLSQVPSWACW